jgi:hypothetical protein
MECGKPPCGISGKKDSLFAAWGWCRAGYVPASVAASKLNVGEAGPVAGGYNSNIYSITIVGQGAAPKEKGSPRPEKQPGRKPSRTMLAEKPNGERLRAVAID